MAFPPLFNPPVRGTIISGPIEWDWRDPKGQRKLATVADHILWSYAMLSVTRQIMNAREAGKPDRFHGGRTKWASIVMTQYQEQRKNISTLDRDDRLAQDGVRVCAHCGIMVPSYEWDHLIPQSRLDGEYVAFNQVRSCRPCNVSRGNKDFMLWHRQRRSFPTLGTLRRYLKLCYFYAKQTGCLEVPVPDAVEDGLPFDPRHLPRKFPAAADLVWDYAHPETRMPGSG